MQNDGIYTFDLSDLENRDVQTDTYFLSLTLTTQIQYSNLPESVKEFTFVVNEYDCRPQSAAPDLFVLDANFE